MGAWYISGDLNNGLIWCSEWVLVRSYGSIFEANLICPHLCKLFIWFRYSDVRFSEHYCFVILDLFLYFRVSFMHLITLEIHVLNVDAVEVQV